MAAHLYGRVGNWDRATMNGYDKHFHPVAEPYLEQTIVLADFGLRSKDGVSKNIKLCEKGSWN
ncbi:MAG: hypothetical protein QGM50_06965 [Anaerolineae bacterium]|nr:hypothetical protein [Anaerolineae bacterium]